MIFIELEEGREKEVNFFFF